MNSKSILDLPNYIKAARELSLMGGYHKSLEIYKKIFRLIDNRLHEVSTDNYLVTKWKDTRQQLQKEVALIFSAYQYCKIFNSESLPNNLEPYQYQNNNINKNNNNYYANNDKYVYNDFRGPIKEDAKRWAHFGGKAPFSYLQEKNNKEENNVIQNYVANKPRYSDINYLNNLYKDPDVWTSPEEDPRFSYESNKYQRPKRPPSHKNLNYDKIDLKYHYILSRKIQTLKIVTISVTNIKTQKKEASTIKNLKKNLQKVRS